MLKVTDDKTVRAHSASVGGLSGPLAGCRRLHTLRRRVLHLVRYRRRLSPALGPAALSSRPPAHSPPAQQLPFPAPCLSPGRERPRDPASVIDPWPRPAFRPPRALSRRHAAPLTAAGAASPVRPAVPQVQDGPGRGPEEAREAQRALLRAHGPRGAGGLQGRRAGGTLLSLCFGQCSSCASDSLPQPPRPDDSPPRPRSEPPCATPRRRAHGGGVAVRVAGRGAHPAAGDARAAAGGGVVRGEGGAEAHPGEREEMRWRGGEGAGVPPARLR